MNGNAGLCSSRCKAIAFFVGLVATVLYSAIVLGPVGKSLTTVQAPSGIVSFELAGNAGRAAAILESWRVAPGREKGTSALDDAKTGLYRDFGFIALYAMTLALGCWLARNWAACTGWCKTARLMLALTLFQIVAGFLDAAENGYLLKILSGAGPHLDAFAQRAAVCAWIKFGLIALGAIASLAAIRFHPEFRFVFDRSLRPWFEWVFRYPLLALIAVGVVMIVQDPPKGDPPGLGLHFLFWHDTSLVQFLAGLGLSLVIGELAFVGYLLDADEDWMNPEPIVGWRLAGQLDAGERRQVIRRRLYLGFTAVPLLIAVGWPASHDIFRRFWLLIGLVVGTVGSVAIGWRLLRWMNKDRAGRFRTCLNDYVPWLMTVFRIPSNPFTVGLHVVAFVFFSVIFVLYVVFVVVSFAEDPIATHVIDSAAAAICLLLGLVVAVFGRVVFSVQSRYFGVFATLVVVFISVAGMRSFPHRFDGLADFYDKNPARLAGVQLEERAADERVTAAELENLQILTDWRTQHPDAPNPKPPLFIVAVSGGGLRAALWTTVVLTGLERAFDADSKSGLERGRFASHVRLITGTSGGMLGAAYYAATLPEPGVAPTVSLEDLVSRIGQDSLSAPARALVLRDLPFPGLSNFDRGQAVERAWEQNTNQVLCKELSTLAEGEQAGWLPSLVFTPMMVEDGRRLLISNLDLAHLLKNSGSSLDEGGPAKDATYSISAVQFRDLFPDAKLKLSTAVRMNASFPYVTPAGVLPTDPPRRIVDAGYYDNFGVNLAASYLANLWAGDESRSWLLENVSRVVLIQIVDHPVRDDRTTLLQTGERPRPAGSRGLDWLTTPVNAALSARDSTMSFRNDEQIQQLSRLFNAEHPDFFTTVTFEFTGEASLSWYLSGKEREYLKDCMTNEGNQQLVKLLNDLLPERP